MAMILLEPGNRILEQCVRSQLMSEEKSRSDLKVNLCDFDDVSYKVQVDKESMEYMTLSMGLPCYHQIEEKGAKASLEKAYGDFVTEAEVGYDITLKVKVADAHNNEDVVKKLQLIKSTVTGGVFDYYFTALLEKQPVPEPFKFDLRSDTTVYFKPSDDRVTVIFSIDFTERVDKAVAKVFMQEFEACRKKIGRAPPCKWGANPPTELAHWGVTENEGNLGYLSFAILPSHLGGDKKGVVVGILQSFRTFLQYHIICSKSQFHAKMRRRVHELLKVKNRAHKNTEVKEKKTVGGKTFKRS